MNSYQTDKIKEEVIAKIIKEKIDFNGQEHALQEVRYVTFAVEQFGNKFGLEGLNWLNSIGLANYFDRYIQEVCEYSDATLEGAKRYFDLEPCMCTIDTASDVCKSFAETLGFFEGVKAVNGRCAL